MSQNNKSFSGYEKLEVTPRCFLRGARCTNVNTFGILPAHRDGWAGENPRNSASLVFQNS